MTSTVAEVVLARAGDPEVGLLFEGRTWTWGEVVDEAQRRSEWLLSQKGTGQLHVGVLMENLPEYVFLLAGAALSGTVVVGLNSTRVGDELVRDIRQTDCAFVVAEGPRSLPRTVVDCTSPEYLSGSRGRDLAVERLPAPDDLFVLIFTSGSTGNPKAVKVSHARAARSAESFGFGRGEVLYSAMPLFHGNALFASLLPAFSAGCRLVLRRRFSASAFLDDVRVHGCTYFNTVGRAIAHINATPPTSGDRDHRLKWVLGPETSEVDKAAFTDRFGVPVFDGYGSSENAVILHPAPARTGRPGALGVAPPGTDIAVVDPGTGEELPPARFDEAGKLLNPGEAIGELVGRDAASRFEGYYNDPAAEAERRRGGWYWTGDLAYRDEEGVFYFAGRAGDWLRVDSENFAAAPVERILARAPGIAGVAVYPVPDVRTGDQAMVAVEVAPGAAFDPDAFGRFLADQPDLSPKWVPAYVRVVAALPVTGTDKIDKQPLRASAWRTRDPLWRRVERTFRYEAVTSDDVAELESKLEGFGRENLLAR